MVSRLEMVLRELNENGNFRASLFATSTGLVLASQKTESVNEKTIAAMSSLFAETANSASKEMDLSNLNVMKIKYEEDYIVFRNIILSKTNFILIILSNLPESQEIENYTDQLLDWAIDNSKDDLERLSSI